VESRQRELVHQSVLVLASFVALIITSSATRLCAQDTADGTASGQLIVNAVTVPLTHAYAIAQPGFFDKSKEDVRVLLSSVPLSKDALEDMFELIKLARADRGDIVEVVIDASGAPISGAIYTKAFDGMVSASGMHTFTREHFERKRIAGRLGRETVSADRQGAVVRGEGAITFPPPVYPGEGVRNSEMNEARSRGPRCCCVPSHLIPLTRKRTARG